MVDLNYNFECDWLIELSDKLSDNNLARVENRGFKIGELVENRVFFKPITIDEIVIFLIS